MCIVSGGRKGRVGWGGTHDGMGGSGRLADVGGCVGVWGGGGGVGYGGGDGGGGECVVAYGGEKFGSVWWVDGLVWGRVEEEWVG